MKNTVEPVDVPGSNVVVYEATPDSYETSQNVDKSSELMTGKLFWKTNRLLKNEIKLCYVHIYCNSYLNILSEVNYLYKCRY